MRCHFTPLRTAKFSALITPNAGDTVQHLELWLLGDGLQDATNMLEDSFMQN